MVQLSARSTGAGLAYSLTLTVYITYNMKLKLILYTIQPVFVIVIYDRIIKLLHKNNN
jgi:hypothetical protein